MFHALIFNCCPSKNYRSGSPYRVATFLRSHGWDVEVIEYSYFWKLEELIELVNSRINNNTKFIGFSTMFSVWTEKLEFFLRYIKKQYPNLLTIIGGQGSHKINSDVDYYISGYGEFALLEILKIHFSNSTNQISLDPNFLNLNKKVIRHEEYPSAPLKSLLISYEDRDFIRKNEWLSIEFSRGCKFECAFCNFPILGVKDDYTRDADDFEYHIKDIYDRFGVTNYLVADETFNDSTKKIKKYADVVEKLNFNPFFSGFIRGDLLVARKDDREHLARMGFLFHYYGIETFNYQSGKIIGKGMDPEKLKSGLLDIKTYFKKNQVAYRGEISLIIGLPYETETTVENTINWILENWLDQAAHTWPLEIPDDLIYDKKNLISMNKEKYGYRKFSDPEIILSENTSFFSNNIAMVNSYFNWENNYMNFPQARKISAEVNKRLIDSGIKIGNWDFSLFSSRTMEEQLKVEQKEMEVVDETEIHNIIKSYKENKFNLKL